MQNIYENLFYDYYIKDKINSAMINTLITEIEKNEKRLKEHFNKKQKKLFLRIIYAKDLISEESKLESFIAGFKLGLWIGYESNKE